MKGSCTDTDHPPKKDAATQVSSDDLDIPLWVNNSQSEDESEKSLKTDNVSIRPQDVSESRSSDYTDDYVMDSDDHEGLRAYGESGVSLVYVNGVFYTPPGFKRFRVKCTRAHASNESSSDGEANTNGSTKAKTANGLV